MTDDASAGTRGTGESSSEYEMLLDHVDGAIEEAARKVNSGRVYDPENEKVRIKWIRALAYAANVRRQITNDRTLEELSERIEQLEQHQE